MKPDEEDLDAIERGLLREGYAELVPGAAEQAFALGALSVRLPGALTPPTGGSSAGVVKSASLGTAAKLAAGTVIVGALGFALGVQVATPARSVVPAEAAVPAAPAPGVVNLGQPAHGVALSELDSEPSRAPAVGALRPDSTTESAHPAKEVASAPAEVTFYEELSYIRRAQTALAQQNPGLALGLMRTLAEMRADGALVAERTMTEILALCALGQEDEASGVAARLRQRKDGAMYAPRLDKTCARAPSVESGDDSSTPPTSTQ